MMPRRHPPIVGVTPPSTARGALSVSTRTRLAIGLVALCASIAALALACVPALAAPPEMPETLNADPINGTSATLHGVLNPTNPGEPGRYEFRYLPSASECEREEVIEGQLYHVWDTGGAGEAFGKQHEAVEGIADGVEAGGLEPSTTYTFCLHAQNEAGEESVGAAVTFTTPAMAPGVSHESIVAAAESEATVGAEIDPGSLATAYRVEYGTGSTYGSSTPEVSAGAAKTSTPVRVRLSGLQPGVHYHFRFVASNELGSGAGDDESFSTSASVGATSSLLPDGRVYELVSSATNNQTVDSPNGGEHGTSSGGEDESAAEPFRAALGGDALAYAGQPALEGGSGALGDGQSNEWIAKRGAGGWTSEDVTPPGADSSAEYVSFSSDLSTGVFLADNATKITASPMSPGCDAGDVYSRTGDGGYHALISGLGAGGTCGEPVAPYISADGSQLLFVDEAALTAGAAAGVANGSPYTLSGGYNLYDSASGALHQVNVLPDGQPEPNPSAWLGGPPQGQLASADYSNAVASGGSRIFWTSVERAGEGENIPRALYVRENDTQPQSPLGPGGDCTNPDDACTVQVDAAEQQCLTRGACTSGGGLFWTASSDGSKVFFTDENRLTADSTAVPGEPDLYEYDVNAENGKPGTLTDLTAAHGAPADVRAVIGAGEDGTYVYFVAGGVLTDGPNAEGKEPIAGGDNLYMRRGAVTTFVAPAVGATFNGLWEKIGDLRHAPSNRTAEVSPDGHDVVFESSASLTGYDNEGTEGKLAPEVYVYDALSGRLACASCNPNGTPPSGPIDTEDSLLPVPGDGGRYMKDYATHWLSDDGSRVFFETSQPLVSQDSNGLLDVYEWERNGAGSCAAVATGEPQDGCIYLISGGQSLDNSYLVEADAEGDNVFFTSRGKLTPQAHDENVAVYDARVGGGFPELATECTGTGCQGVPPAPPIFATPSSATFAGVGNFEPVSTVLGKRLKQKPLKCRRGFAAKHGRCLRRKPPARTRHTGRSRRGSKR